ncbi:MAG: TetR/AcrR family transcriptional regulator [Rhodospirillales bacterium]
MNKIAPKTTAKGKIVKSAKKLILDKGYAMTSVDEIVTDAGVSKGSFYHFFDSKEDVGLEALDEFLSEGGAIMMNGAFLELEDPVERAFGFLRHVEDVAFELWNHGCLLVIFSVDTAGRHLRIKKETEKRLAGMKKNIGLVLAPLAKKLTVGIKPEELVGMYLSVIDGSIVYARATGDTTEIARNLKTFRRQMEALVKKR